MSYIVLLEYIVHLLPGAMTLHSEGNRSPSRNLTQEQRKISANTKIETHLSFYFSYIGYYERAKFLINVYGRNSWPGSAVRFL